MSFASLKKQSTLGSLTAKLVKEVEKVNNSGGGDDRLWKPELDKTGNGYAVIRFLPAPDGEEIPWAKLYSHAFQGPGGWYIENSLTTTGGKILSLITIVPYGIVVMKQTRIQFVNRSVSYLITATSMLLKIL